MESDTTIIGAEKEKLRMELNNKEVALKKEKTEQEAVRQKLEKLESQLLSGTGSVAVQSILNNEANMVDHTNEQQKVLEKRKKEVAERRRAQQADIFFKNNFLDPERRSGILTSYFGNRIVPE